MWMCCARGNVKDSRNEDQFDDKCFDEKPRGREAQAALDLLEATRCGYLDHAISSMMFCPNGRTLAIGSCDAAVKLWDTKTGRIMATLSGHAGPVHMLVFSPDGTTLITGCREEATVMLWNTQTGEIEGKLGGRHGIHTVAFSPDNMTIATASKNDTNVHLWSKHTAGEVGTLNSDERCIGTLTFSADGEHLACCGRRGVTIWDVDAQAVQATLPIADVENMQFSPDGTALAMGARDETSVQA